MRVDVEDARLFGRRRHPAPTQVGAPLLGPSALTQEPNLLAQGAHFRNPIQTQELAPLARRARAQGLHRFESRQSHEGNQHQQAVDPIVPRRQGKLLGAFEQANGQQGGQRKEHPAPRHVDGRLELRRDRIQTAHAGCNPGWHIACRNPHRGFAVARAALALGARDERTGFFHHRNMQPPGTDRFRQGVALDPQFFRNPRDRLAAVQQGLRLPQHICRQDRRAPAPRWNIEPLRPFLPIPLQRALDAQRGYPESARHVHHAQVTLRDQLRRDHPEGRQILLRMTEHRQDAVEIHDSPVLLPDRQQALDRRYRIRKDR
jgi:hypothetical protein